MIKFKRFLSSIAIIMSGMMSTSLLITKTDDWKLYLAICLIAIAFRLSFEDYKK